MLTMRLRGNAEGEAFRYLCIQKISDMYFLVCVFVVCAFVVCVFVIFVSVVYVL